MSHVSLTFTLVRWRQPQNLTYLKSSFFYYSSRAWILCFNLFFFWQSNIYSRWLGFASHVWLSAAISHSLVKAITFDHFSHKSLFFFRWKAQSFNLIKLQKINVSLYFLFPRRCKMQGNIILRQIRGSFLTMLHSFNRSFFEKKQTTNILFKCL